MSAAYLLGNNSTARRSKLAPWYYGPVNPFYHDNFPLMDLPPELRCMVYEQVVYETKSHALNRNEVDLRKTSWPPNPSSASSSIHLIRHCLPVALLRTCRLIHAEATPIFQQKFSDLQKKPLRFQVDYAAMIALTAPSGPLARAFSTGAAHSTPPTSGNRALDAFTHRCGLFLARKPTQHDSDPDSPISVCILITQHHNTASRQLTTAAFEGARKLRATSQRFVCEVQYYLPYGFISMPWGTMPTSPTVRINALLKPAYEWELRKVRAMRDKAQSVVDRRPENRHMHVVVSPVIWSQERVEEEEEKKDMLKLLDAFGL